MRTITRVFALTAALSCCSPLLAEDLVASDLKALTARIGKAVELIDGKLMLVEWLSNLAESNVASR
jgi:hypothetical protein